MRQTRTFCDILYLLLPCLFMAAAAGCSNYSQIRVERESHIGDSYSPVPSSAKVPVLKVNAREAERRISSGWAVGVAECPGAARDFADLVAHAADRAQWAQVLSPIQVEDKVEGQDLEFDLQLDGERLDRVAGALDCPYYLTADVRRWRMSYFLFFQRSCIEYSLSCHEAGREEPLWRAEVEACERYATDRTVAVQALERTFQRVREKGRASSREGGN